MKKLYALIGISFFSFGAMAQTAGGPDAYGYEWRNSFDAQGPTYNWIDITTSGTLVTGLTDDNSVAFVPMGMNFHYYWADYNQLKIGSNGWLAFDNISNIAHCFPQVPTAGGAGDNFMAPMMTDLIMNAGNGSAPEVYYYYDSGTQQFIVSYIDVPWWNAAAPGWAGNNTFQVILSQADSSITFQYLQTDIANLNDQGGCPADLEIGIENQTGNIGLEVYNEAMPASGEAIKFYYPATVLINVPDASPTWSQNVDNQGTFYSSQGAINYQAEVKNVGNGDITNDITANMVVQDLIGTTVFSQTDVITGGLTAGTAQALSYTIPTLAPGQYSVTLSTTNSQDLNPSNNTLTTEMEVVDMAAPSFRMTYATQGANMGQINWTNGGGAGIHVVPPSYPVTLDSVEMYIVDGGVLGDYMVRIYADDGPNGGPGTLLATDTMFAGTYTPNAWIMTALTNPVAIASGGIHIGWVEETGTNLSLGTETAAPISRRTYEFVGGSWAPYRENNNTELMVNGWFSGVCGTFVANVASTVDVSCNGGADGSIDLDVNGGTPGYSYLWDNGAGTVQDPTGLTAGTYNVVVTDTNGCSLNTSVVINEPSALSLFATSQDELNGNDGFIDMFVTGGTTPFTYQWDNGAGTVEDPSGLVGNITYTVIVTDGNGCMDTLSIFVGSQVGVAEAEALSIISVYPNPNNGQFVIDASEAREHVTVTILNAVGQTVKTLQIAKGNTANINLSTESKGIYFLQMNSNNEQRTDRLIVR